jgi:hypothetical protein
MRNQVVITTFFSMAFSCGVVWSQVASNAVMEGLPPDYAGERHDIATDPSARRMFWDLVRHARYGFSNREQVAFIIRERDGALSCVVWPSSGEPDSGRWEGPFPTGVVAIAHTHPNWLPVPSSIDIRTATRTRTPVYVVTRSQIYETAGGEPVAVARTSWKPETSGDGMPSACRFPS